MNKKELLECLEKKQRNIDILSDEINLINLKIKQRLSDYFEEHILSIVFKNLEIGHIYEDEFKSLKVTSHKYCSEKLFENEKFKEFKSIFEEYDTYSISIFNIKYRCMIDLKNKIEYPSYDYYLVFKFENEDDIRRFCEDFNIDIKWGEFMS